MPAAYIEGVLLHVANNADIDAGTYAIAPAYTRPTAHTAATAAGPAPPRQLIRQGGVLYIMHYTYYTKNSPGLLPE